MDESALQAWRVDLRRPLEWIQWAIHSVLRTEESARHPGESEERWRRRLAARAALRVALAGRLDRHPRSLRLQAGANGKPRLDDADGPALQFNLSDSAELCVIALSEAGPVGVDVEAVRPRPQLERLAQMRLAPAEAQAILELDGEDRLHAFYRVWTRKEAYLKASGAGLTVRLDSFAVSAGAEPALISQLPGNAQSWTLHDLELGGRFHGAIALSARAGQESASIKPQQMQI